MPLRPADSDGRATRPPDDLAIIIDLCRSYLPLIKPGQFFSHLTAARLWGCPLPTRVQPHEPIHISSPPPTAEPRRVGVIGHRSSLPLSSLTLRYGLPVSDPPSTWLSLATMIPLDELIAVGDHLILDPVVLDPRDVRPHATLEALAAAVNTSHGRGVRLAASALRDLRHGSESRPETLVRLLLVRGGLPEPQLNIEIRDASGRFLGRGDMVYPTWRTLVEYDGDHHRTNAVQYNTDITRIERFIDDGWNVIRVRKSALFGDPAGVLERVRRALIRGGWRG